MAEFVFYGETFRSVDEVGEFALMEFAAAAQLVDEESLAGMAAIMHLLKATVVPEDWARFQAHARKERASSEACMAVVMEAFEQETDRPTVRPSDSSAGPRLIEPNSEVVSSSAAERLASRPDFGLVALRAKQARSA